jgi:hypothetical protein
VVLGKGENEAWSPETTVQKPKGLFPCTSMHGKRPGAKGVLEPTPGLGPGTCGLQNRCYYQLSYVGEFCFGAEGGI